MVSKPVKKMDVKRLTIITAINMMGSGNHSAAREPRGSRDDLDSLVGRHDRRRHLSGVRVRARRHIQ